MRNPTLFLLFALSACAAGKDYVAPQPVLREQWNTLNDADEEDKEALEAEEQGPHLPWWQRFRDDILTQLIETSLDGNIDIKIAAARIREARATDGAALAGLLPQIDATASASRQKARSSLQTLLDNETQAGLSANWDIDLFGAGRRRLEAAGASVEAAQYEEAQARIMLAAEVARNYVRLRATQKQYAITQKNLEMQQQTLTVTQGQRSEGAVSNLEVARASAEVKATEARLPQLKTSIALLVNHLNVLAGQPPGVWDDVLKPFHPLPVAPRTLVLNTPVNTIASRPDVQAAERRLAQTSALSAAAIADFYPRLSLQGFFGTQHSSLYGTASPWSGTASALLPLLDFGKLVSASHAADARQEQALLTYQQTVLQSLEEVENNLVSYLNELKRHSSLITVAANQATAATIAAEQYRVGVAAQIDLLVAERNRLDAQNDVVLSEAAIAENIILLYRSLGAF